MNRSAAVWKACLIFALFLFGFGGVSEAGLKIYFIRHAEGGHNVVKEWKDKPRDQWPAYIGNENMFSPKGEEQVALVAGKLAPYHFAFIACSPLWRARNTILPYLQQQNLKAEIWPELEEVDFKEAAAPLPTPSPNLFSGGKEIVLPDSEKAWFQLPQGTTHRIKVASQPKEQSRADVQAIMDELAKRIVTRFGKTDQAILLVGHGSSGCLLLKRLTGQNQPSWPMNTGLWMVEEQPDGPFTLRIFNDKPYP